MTDHPLTDDLAEDIASTEFEFPFGIGETVFTYNDMRKAADWQLEQCIDWLVSLDRTHYTHLARLMRKAMRPQEDNS